MTKLRFISRPFHSTENRLHRPFDHTGQLRVATDQKRNVLTQRELCEHTWIRAPENSNADKLTGM